MERLVCINCKKEVPITAMINHLKKEHCNLSLYEQVLIHQKSLTTAKIKIKYVVNEFVKVFLKETGIDDLKMYAKQIYVYGEKFNSFCDMVVKYRNIELQDIDVFFNIYLPYKKAHPKDVNSFALAEIVCHNHLDQVKDFYEKVLLVRNAYTGHGGELSPWSKKFKSYQGMSDEEKQKAIRQKVFCKDRDDFDELKKNSSCTLDYYLARGMSEEDAKKALKERQSTFSLKKCIEKYGEEEGTKRFKERQEKWMSNLPKSNYSQISQKLFWAIYNQLPKEIKYECKFATNDNGIRNDHINKEYIFELNESYAKLDFYIPSLKCWIEFDGDYWHGEARGNQERDRKREEAIKKAMPDIKLKRVSERDFNANPESIISECVEWINSFN